MLDLDVEGNRVEFRFASNGILNWQLTRGPQTSFQSRFPCVWHSAVEWWIAKGHGVHLQFIGGEALLPRIVGG